MSPPIHDYVTEALVYHPSNSRTGLPETRRPACAGLADIALKAIRTRLKDLLDTEDFSDDHLGVQRVIELLDER